MTISAVNPIPRIHLDRKACLIEIMIVSLNSQRNGVRQIEMAKKCGGLNDDSTKMDDRRSHKQPSWRDGRHFLDDPDLGQRAVLRRAEHFMA